MENIGIWRSCTQFKWNILSTKRGIIQLNAGQRYETWSVTSHNDPEYISAFIMKICSRNSDMKMLHVNLNFINSLLFKV